MQKTLPSERVRIIADSREDALIDILHTFDCDVIEKRLELADFIISDEIGVERKSAHDFVRSVMDGRLFSQIANLRGSFAKPVLLIEGKNLYGIHPNAIRGAVSSIAIDYGVPIIWTDSIEDTASYLYTIARREQLEKGKEVGIKGERKPFTMGEYQEYVIASLPGIGPLTAKSLLSHFGSVEKVFSASEKALQEAAGVGKDKAKRIRAVISQEYGKA